MSVNEEKLTGEIIKAYYKVYNTLGFGFLESIYKNAMTIELVSAGLSAQCEQPIGVHYNGRVVGTFAADIIVEDRVIIELKAKEKLAEAHEAQLTNYLRATAIEVGLLFNFGRTPEFKRKFFSNSNKFLSSEKPAANILEALFKKDPL